MISNPSLHAQPRHQVSPIIASNTNVSIFNWIEQTGRFIQGDDDNFTWSQDEEDLLAPLLLKETEEEEE